MNKLAVIAYATAALAFAPGAAVADPGPPVDPETCAFLPFPQSQQCLREQHRAYCNEHFVRLSPEWIACLRED